MCAYTEGRARTRLIAYLYIIKGMAYFYFSISNVYKQWFNRTGHFMVDVLKTAWKAESFY